MKIDGVLLLGSAAAVLTTAAFLPQVIKAHTTRHTKDISLAMFVLTAAGVTLWAAYGIVLRSVPVIVANSLVLLLSGYLIYLKIKHG